MTLTPFDYIADGGPCTHGLAQFTHTPSVRFPRRGEATVIVPGRNGFQGEVISLARIVAVE